MRIRFRLHVGVSLCGLLLVLHLSPQSGLAETDTSDVASHSFDISIERPMYRRAHVVARMEIPTPPERVWAVLTDYDHLADFIPSLDISRVLEGKSDGLRLYQEGKVWWLLFPQRVKVTFQVQEIPYEQISFKAVEGDFTLHEGSWRLQSVPKGTQVSYEASIEPKFWIPRWVLGLLEHQIIKATFRAIRQRCLIPFPGDSVKE